MEEIIFASGSVPVAVAARVYGKDASWIRAGIVSGWLPIGKATRSGKLVTNLEEMNSKYGRINLRMPMSVWTRSRIVKSIKSPRRLKWQSLSKIDTSDLVWLPLSWCCR